MTESIESLIVPSSSVPLSDPEFDTYSKILLETRENVLSEVQKYEIRGNERKKLDELVDDIKEDIINTHSAVGIQIDKNTIPPVILISEDDISKLPDEIQHKLKPDSNLGHANIYLGLLKFSIVIVSKDEKKDLALAESIYHEMLHSVGRTAIAHVLNGNGKIQQNFVSGYISEGESHNGYLMEEVTAIVFADNYVRFGTRPSLTSARENALEYLKEHGIELTGQQNTDVKNYLTNFRYGSAAEVYDYAYDIGDLLLFGSKVAGNYKEFCSLMLGSRIDTNKRRNFFDMISENFDRDTARQLFRQEFTGSALQELVELRKKMLEIVKERTANFHAVQGASSET